MPLHMTDTAINKALRTAATTRQRRDLADAGQPGLRVRVTPAGSATWVLACRDGAGRMRRFRLGGYPALGIGQARAAARETHYLVRNQGADPTADRRRERAKAAAAKEGIGTLAALLDLYERQPGSKLRSWPQYRSSIQRVFGAFLGRPLADLRPHDLQLVADAYGAQQQAAMAVRCVRPILKWAGGPSRSYCTPELASITVPATPQRRDRVLSPEELAKLLPVLRMSNRPHARALRFMMLTLCRREEACDARWREINLETRTWKFAVKNTRPHEVKQRSHEVPLSDQAIELLRSVMPEALNPDSRIFATSRGGAPGNWDRATKLLQAASETSGWHRHDIRRTSATMLGELVPRVIHNVG